MQLLALPASRIREPLAPFIYAMEAMEHRYDRTDAALARRRRQALPVGNPGRPRAQPPLSQEVFHTQGCAPGLHGPPPQVQQCPPAAPSAVRPATLRTIAMSAWPPARPPAACPAPPAWRPPPRQTRTRPRRRLPLRLQPRPQPAPPAAGSAPGPWRGRPAALPRCCYRRLWAPQWRPRSCRRVPRAQQRRLPTPPAKTCSGAAATARGRPAVGDGAQCTASASGAAAVVATTPYTVLRHSFGTVHMPTGAVPGSGGCGFDVRQDCMASLPGWGPR